MVLVSLFDPNSPPSPLSLSFLVREGINQYRQNEDLDHKNRLF